MRAHDRLHSAADRRAERRQRAHVWVFFHYRQPEVGVDRGVAVAWKMFGARRYAGALQARDPRDGVRGDGRRVRTEGADADDGVLRVGVHVDHRGEVEVDPHLGQLSADRTRNLAGEGWITGGAEGEVARVRASRPRLQARDVAALFVDRDHELRALRVQLFVQGRQLRPVLDVASIENHPAQTGRDATKHPVGS